MTEKLFSGIRPTGDIHIGNYLGAVQNWVNLQDKYQSYFSIVDYHGIISEYDPKEMPSKIKNMATGIIASGVNPDTCTLFVQSHVPQHTELSWILSCVTNLSWLNGMIQFKEKSEQQSGNVNVGLYCYPVLQTADIAIYNARKVPVGEDQVQHIELARDVIRKFNSVYGEILIEPEALITKAKRIMGLDAVNKMSKSLNNYISIIDSSETILQKLKPAVTDTARVRRTDPGEPENCNVYLSFHKYFSDRDSLATVEEGCRTAGIGCFDCKKILHKNMNSVLEPIRDKYHQLTEDNNYVDDVLKEGAKKAGEIAQKTVDKVKSTMGLI